MSTEENKELVRRLLDEVFNKHNLKIAEELMTSDWVYHGGEDIKGLEDFKQFINEGYKIFPDQTMTIEDMVAEGDKVVTRYTFKGTHKGDFMGIPPTGRSFAVLGIAIDRIQDGKAVETWDIMDMLGLMQQLGVIPPMGQ